MRVEGFFTTENTYALSGLTIFKKRLKVNQGMNHVWQEHQTAKTAVHPANASSYQMPRQHAFDFEQRRSSSWCKHVCRLTTCISSPRNKMYGRHHTTCFPSHNHRLAATVL